MKSKTEIDSSFEYPDSKNRNLFVEFCFAVNIGFILSIVLLTAICHADKIDDFVNDAIQIIFYGTSEQKAAYLMFLSSTAIFVITIRLLYIRIIKSF